MSTTDTHEKLAKPEIRAKQIAENTEFAEITEGSEKQIKYANDLRKVFLSKITNQENDAIVRWAVIKQTERGERLTKLDVFALATDAWNRRAINMINTNDAKKIIEHFVSVEGKQRMLDTINRYDGIISRPEKWAFDGKKWIQNYK